MAASLLSLGDDGIELVAAALAVPFPPVGVGRLSSACRELHRMLLPVRQKLVALSHSIHTFLLRKCSPFLSVPYHTTVEMLFHEHRLAADDCDVLGELVRVETLPNLRTLSLYRQPLVGPVGMRALARGLCARSAPLATLQELNLYQCALTATGAAALAPGLAALPGMQRLYLSDNAVGDVGLSALAPQLIRLDQLHILTLCDNDIGDRGLEALLDAIVAHPLVHRLPSLREITLLGRNAISDAGCASLAAALVGGALPCLRCSVNFMRGCPASKAAIWQVICAARGSTRPAHLRKSSVGSMQIPALQTSPDWHTAPLLQSE